MNSFLFQPFTGPSFINRYIMNVKSLLFLLLCSLLTSIAWAQQGKIAGVIVDKENGETIIGANVLVDGTGIGSSTDLEGKYIINALAPGSYTLVVSYIGYNMVTVQNVDVFEGKGYYN